MQLPFLRVTAVVSIFMFVSVSQATAGDLEFFTGLNVSTNGNLVYRQARIANPPLPAGSWQRTTLPGNDWADSRGAIMWRNRIFYADDSGNMWIKFVNRENEFGPRRPVDMRAVDQTWDLSEITGMYYLPSSPQSTEGRVYYTMEGDSRLLWRQFDPSVANFGDQEFEAQNQADIKWSDVRGMDVSDGYLFFGRSNDYLYRVALNDEGEPEVDSTMLVNGPVYSSTYWGTPFLTGFEYTRVGTGRIVNVPLAGFSFARGNFTTPYGFRFFKHSFNAEPNQALNVRASWGPDRYAVVNVFLRDPSGQLLASDTNATTPNTGLKWLSATADSGGTYTVSVMIKKGLANYNVSVNPLDQPAGPRADHEFSSRGDSWEIFRFNVEAGDPVNARVIWDDLNSGEVRVFLRDETGNQVARSTHLNGSPKELSAVAQNSGQWSVAVRAVDRPIDYEVLVNTWSNRR